jgi:hypothetical protein
MDKVWKLIGGLWRVPRYPGYFRNTTGVLFLKGHGRVFWEFLITHSHQGFGIGRGCFLTFYKNMCFLALCKNYLLEDGGISYQRHDVCKRRYSREENAQKKIRFYSF